MSSHPTVSEFTLNQDHSQPPHLTRSRNRFQKSQRIYHPHNHVSFGPQQVIIDVSLNSALNVPVDHLHERDNQGGIRKHIDACLNAIEVAYNEQRSRQGSSNTPNGPIVNDRTIHRIDTNLVLEYTQTICNDYKLRDRFGKNEPAVRMPVSHQRQKQELASPSNQQRSHSLGSEAKSKKQYLNLTQTSKLDRRGFSAQKHRPQQPTSPRTHRQNIHTSPQIMANQIRLANFKSPIIAKIEQDFRYCINCQATILSKNVDFHQKYQCKDFSSLYKLSFSELTAMVGEKVQKMSRQLKHMLQWLKEKDLSKSRSESICNQTLQMIEQFANENSLSTSLDKIDTDYQKIKASLNNEYIQVVKITHKLHWFNQVYANLKKECGKRREGSRVLDLNSLTPGVARVFQESKLMPPSPIAQLYPHLHRPSLSSPRPLNYPN